ncbi:MAG: MerR family transcriptional regulator [Armatimonadetes bacterium]|nr:MerR family transcriptional regulator [Armatimonadota bacterium]
MYTVKQALTKLNSEGYRCTARILKYWEDKLRLDVTRKGKRGYRVYTDVDIQNIREVLGHKLAITQKIRQNEG